MDDEIDLNDASLFADSNRGQYIPQYFAESIHRPFVANVSDEQWKILEAGPNSELYAESYWETWDEVLNDAIINDPWGRQWTLYQDGDLWLIPKDEN